MKKSILLISGLLMSVSLIACGKSDVSDGPESEEVLPVIELNEDVNNTSDADTAAETDNKESENETHETENSIENPISDDVAKSAVMNYCFEQNSGLKDMYNSDEYTIYWEVEHSDESQIVVLYRSYTAAEVRFYIDRITGDTYVTEFVQGITEQEEKTDESFNIKSYINENQE